VINAQTLRNKIEALRELRREKAKRKAEAAAQAYANTVAARGEIPRLFLDGDNDEQRRRALAEHDDPEYWIERVFIEALPRPDGTTRRRFRRPGQIPQNPTSRTTCGAPSRSRPRSRARSSLRATAYWT
jgi:hypothetical protein